MNQGAKGYQEGLLVDTLDRMRRNPEGRKVVHLRLSQLLPQNRTPVRLKILTRMFRPMESGRQIQIFQMTTSDMVIVVNAGAQREIQNIVHRIRTLFESDPLMMTDGSGEDKFAAWYDLTLDAPMAMQAAQELRVIAQSAAPQNTALAAPPLTPQMLDEVQKRLAFANIVPFVRDQPVLRIEGGEASIEFYEFFLSVAELQRAAAPNVNLLGDRWLFQDLSRTMDQRMLETVIRAPHARESAALSLNLNLESILTQPFLSFIERLGQGKKVIVEVQAVDVFTNLAMYLDVQGALNSLNHAILLDGLNTGTLRLIDVGQLKPDYAKVTWAPEMEGAGRGSEILQELVTGVGAGKVILSRCESAQALSSGLKNGVTLFQGRFLDAFGTGRRRAARPGAA
jgi:EAL domain-containing protein (putative c-di-GMP-specific phosphodiesterase class I)